MKDRYAINDSFIKIYNSLVADNKIKGKGELAILLDVKASTISEIIAKRQGVTTEFIQKFCDVFPSITPNDFFEVTEIQKKEDKNEEIIRLQRQLLKVQEELLKAKEKEIKKTEKQVGQLKND